MASAPRGIAAVLIVVFALVWGGCSTSSGDSIDDSEIISALNLKKVSGGYEMNGDPFCRIDDILNDLDEVKAAGHKKGASFVIAAPKGQAGVVARTPFAPACKREAQQALDKLVKPEKKKR
jgi:hypothetical protein